MVLESVYKCNPFTVLKAAVNWIGPEMKVNPLKDLENVMLKGKLLRVSVSVFGIIYSMA